MNITIDYPTLYATVARSLSIIGKRSTDDNGNLLFKDITVGTNEESIFNDYFRQAVIDLAAELSGFIVAASSDNITFCLDLPSNHSEAVEPFIQQSCKAYCVSYALFSWFTVTAPRISQKYNGDCSRQVNALIRLVHEKNPPESSELTYADISGEVILNT